MKAPVELTLAISSIPGGMGGPFRLLNRLAWKLLKRADSSLAAVKFGALFGAGGAEAFASV